MNTEDLLAEVEELIRTLPTLQDFDDSKEGNLEWAGRATAILEKVDLLGFSSFSVDVQKALSGQSYHKADAYPKITFAMQKAKSVLVYKLPSVRSTAISKGSRFRYFDEITKILQCAQSELYIIDPYLDQEFASTYLEPLSRNLKLRLLGKKQAEIKTLIQGAKMLSSQGPLKIEVRSTATIHDRYIFVDRTSCFQSGASFKDGAKSAGTVIVQIVDAFTAMQTSYESLWNASTIEYQ